MRFSKIKDNDVVNGKGIMMSIWTQGCPHRCKECFNPETWNYTGGKLFTEQDLAYILTNINQHGVQRNLAILGGEPLCPENVEGVLGLCQAFKEHYPGKKIYLWTGYVLEHFTEKQKEILSFVDVVIDGPFQREKKDYSLTLRGSSNQRIINVKELSQRR